MFSKVVLFPLHILEGSISSYLSTNDILLSGHKKIVHIVNITHRFLDSRPK